MTRFVRSPSKIRLLPVHRSVTAVETVTVLLIPRIRSLYISCVRIEQRVDPPRGRSMLSMQTTGAPGSRRIRRCRRGPGVEGSRFADLLLVPSGERDADGHPVEQGDRPDHLIRRRPARTRAGYAAARRRRPSQSIRLVGHRNRCADAAIGPEGRPGAVPARERSPCLAATDGRPARRDRAHHDFAGRRHAGVPHGRRLGVRRAAPSALGGARRRAGAARRVADALAHGLADPRALCVLLAQMRGHARALRALRRAVSAAIARRNRDLRAGTVVKGHHRLCPGRAEAGRPYARRESPAGPIAFCASIRLLPCKHPLASAALGRTEITRRPMTAPTRDQILDAAAHLYGEHGFRGTTTRRIAQEAGVNEVTLFRLFGSKTALLLEALRVHGVEPTHAELPAVPADPLAELTDWCMHKRRAISNMRAIIRKAMSEFEENPAMPRCVTHGAAATYASLREYLQRLNAAGFTSSKADASAAASMLISTVFHDAIARDMMPQAFPQPSSAAPGIYARLCLKSLGVDAAAQKGRTNGRVTGRRRALLAGLILTMCAGAAAPLRAQQGAASP